MKKKILILLCFVPLFAFSEDWSWWNIKHGWQIGMPSWRSFIHITPGYLGPNALPVPEVKKGIVLPGNTFEFGVSTHFREGDPTQDLWGKYYRSFAEGKIAIEVFGVMLEHYAMSEFVRDERIARDYDGKGIANGDLYFSTLVQLVKGRKFRIRWFAWQEELLQEVSLKPPDTPTALVIISILAFPKPIQAAMKK